MKLVFSSCAGLDIHKETVHACARVSGRGQPEMIVEKTVFGTHKHDLERLSEWLRKHGIRRVVMESTGVYWTPVWNVLEASRWKFDLVLVNPQHVRALPGRKTDQQDCERLAELGQYDLLRGSFIPPAEIRELRDLTRRRTHMQQDRNRVVNRIERLLETVNLKLSSVVSDITGKTSWLILKAVAGGENDPARLARMAQGRLKAKKEELESSLHGYANEHFRWLLNQLLGDLENLDSKLTELDLRIRTKMAPHADVIERLRTIPGVQEITAWTLVAELGTDMSRFANAASVASWAGLCPGHKESAGKRQSGRTRKGNRYLRRMLVQNSWAISHSKDCFLASVFHRISARRGQKRAAVAVAHRVLKIAYYIIRDGAVYQELGGSYHDQLHPERTAKRLTRRLESIGFQVTLTKSATGGAATATANPRPVGTARWNTPEAPRRKQEPRQVKSKHAPAHPAKLAATPDLCPRCAKWKIPCIHVRNAAKQASQTNGSTESAT